MSAMNQSDGHQVASESVETDRRIGIIKVGTHSPPSAVAGAIAGMIRDHQYTEVQAIGAGAVNQAIKAIAIARTYLEQDGYAICCVPHFIEIKIGDDTRTAIRLVVQPK